MRQFHRRRKEILAGFGSDRPSPFEELRRDGPDHEQAQPERHERESVTDACGE
jgi:hypothetical protein